MKYVRTLITLVVYLARLAVEIGRCDVVHIFTPGYLAFYLAPVPALLAARLFGKPAILNYHDGRAADHLARWPLARRLMRLVTTIVVPSNYLERIFASFQLRTVRITNIIDSDSWPYRERRDPRPVFLHNRGLAPEYNPACTLRAFGIVQENYPEARLTIAHGGPLEAELKALADVIGLRHTEFIGPVSPKKMAELYDASDIYVMSPDADNMPLSLLECFSAGLPVIASAVGGVPGMIDDGRTGLLFPPGDHQAMASCALRLLEEPGVALRLAQNAHAESCRYGWPHIGPEWLAQYRHLVKPSRNSV